MNFSGRCPAGWAGDTLMFHPVALGGLTSRPKTSLRHIISILTTKAKELPQLTLELWSSLTDLLRSCDLRLGRHSQDAKSCARLEDQSICPIFAFFVSRYFSLCGFASTRIGTCSTISKPYPSRPTTFLGLFVRNRNWRTPRSNRICAPSP